MVFTMIVLCFVNLHHDWLIVFIQTSDLSILLPLNPRLACFSTEVAPVHHCRLIRFRFMGNYVLRHTMRPVAHASRQKLLQSYITHRLTGWQRNSEFMSLKFSKCVKQDKSHF